MKTLTIEDESGRRAVIRNGARNWKRSINSKTVVVNGSTTARDFAYRLLLNSVTSVHQETDFELAMRAASQNPERDAQIITAECFREDWDTPEEDEAWQHLQEAP